MAWHDIVVGPGRAFSHVGRLVGWNHGCLKKKKFTVIQCLQDGLEQASNQPTSTDGYRSNLREMSEEEKKKRRRKRRRSVG